MDEVKTLELDKVCRVCLTTKKEMRPLYGEMVAEMLMEVAPRIHVSKYYLPLASITDMCVCD